MINNQEIPFRAYVGKEPYIFVAYARADNDMVYPIIQELHTRGVNIWYDEGKEFTDEWPAEIADNIMKCSKFLVFLSYNSAESKFIRQQINFANSNRKQILPVYITPADLDTGLEMLLSPFQAISYYAFNAYNEDEFYKRATKALNENYTMKMPIEPQGEIIFSLADNETLRDLIQLRGDGFKLLDGSRKTASLNSLLPYMFNSGHPTITLVKGPLGCALQVTKRHVNGDTIDLPLTGSLSERHREAYKEYLFDFEKYAYDITMVGHIHTEDEAHIAIAAMDAPYEWLRCVPITGQEFVLTCELSYAAIDAAGLSREQFMKRGFTIRTRDASDYTIYNMIITRRRATIEAESNEIISDMKMPELPEGELIFTLAKNKALEVNNSFIALSPFIVNSGSPTIYPAKGPFGIALKITNRHKDDDTIDIPLTGGIDEAFRIRYAAHMFNFNKYEYDLIVCGKVLSRGETSVSIVAMERAEKRVLHTVKTKNNEFILKCELSTAAIDAAGLLRKIFLKRGFRIQPEDRSDYILYEVKIIRREAVKLKKAIDMPSGEVMFSLQDNEALQEIMNTSGAGTRLFGGVKWGYGFGILLPYIINSGHPTITLVTSPYGMGLEITNRQNNFDAIDIPLTGGMDEHFISAYKDQLFDFNKYVYDVVIYGRVESIERTYMCIAAMDVPCNWLKEIRVPPQEFVLKCELSHSAIENSGFSKDQFMKRGFRVQTRCTSDFTIYDFVITRRELPQIVRDVKENSKAAAAPVTTEREILYSFELFNAIVQKRGGLLGGLIKPKNVPTNELILHKDGMSWPEGTTSRVFVKYTDISIIKISKYYGTLAIEHKTQNETVTKKLTLLTIDKFISTWKEFNNRYSVNIKIKNE